MVRGRVVYRFGDDINTDYIIPAPYLQESWDNRFFADHAFEEYAPSFAKLCREGGQNIVVGGKNFGSGSSREQAVYAIKYNDVVAMIAESFPDIFYRNSINNGLLPIRVGSTSGFSPGDEVEIDLASRKVRNLRSGEEQAILAGDNDIKMMLEGGLLGRASARLRERLRSARS